jgi:EmrB/QacA subfamily drug resistance transporter
MLTALAFGVLLAATAQSTIAAALPQLTGEIGSVVNMSWPVTAYLVTAASATPVLAKLADIYSPRAVYLVAMATFLIGAAFAGLAPTLGQLVVSRALQGVGAGGLLALGFGVVGELAPPLRRVRYRNLIAAVWGIGTLLGPVLGAVITDWLGWRWVFFANLPIGLIVLVVVAATLRLPRRTREGDLDLVGALLVALAMVLALLYVARQGPMQGWLSSGGLVLLAEVVAVTMLLLIWENRVKQPLLPLRLLRHPAFVKASVTAVLVGSALFGVVLLFPLHAQVVLGTTPLWSGLLLVPMVIAAAVGAILPLPKGWHRAAFVFGTGAVLVATLLLSQQPVNAARWQTLVLVLVAGAGLGVIWRLAVRIARSVAPADEARQAVPTIVLLQIIGCALGAALAVSMLTSRLADYRGGELTTAAGLHPGMIRLLPDAQAVLGAFSQAGQRALIVTALMIAIAFLLSFTVKAVALRRDAALAESEPEPVFDEETASVAAPEPPATLAEPPEQPLAEPTVDDSPTAPDVVEAKPTEPKAEGQVRQRQRQRRRSPWHRVAVACAAMLVVLATGYGGSLLYAGPGVLRGTTVHGVDIGGLQPPEAEQKLERDLGPAANALIPLQAGNQKLTIDPRAAGLGIDARATVASTARRSFNPVQLVDILLHAPRQLDIRTTSDGARLNSTLTQLDRQIHRNPRDGTILFTAGTPQAIESQDGQSLDIPRAVSVVQAGYLRDRPISLPILVLHPKVSTNEVRREMRDFAQPAVSGPVIVSAGGKTATLPPSVFASHLSVTADASGRLHPSLDGAGVLSDAGNLLAPLQTQPQAGGVKNINGRRVRTPAQEGQVIRPEDLSGAMLPVLSQTGNRTAYVPLTTVQP